MRIGPTLLSTALCLPFLNCVAFAQPVGTAAAVNQSAHGTPPRQAIRTITLGDKIIHDERIETDAKGLLQILLADGTTFTVGPGSELTIDSFVYDPNADAAKITASLGKGVFRFIGGRTSKTPDGVRLNTPVGTVGIRGAITDLMFDPGNGTPSHIDLRYGDDVTLWRPGGSPVKLYEAGYSIVINGPNDIRILRTPEWWTGFFQALISGRGGAGGGVTIKPTGGMVIASRISRSNSDFPLQLNSIPIPIMRPRDHDRQIVEEGTRDIIRHRVEEIIGGGGKPGGGGEEPPPPPTITKRPLRVLTISSDATGEGIVGGSEATDQATILAAKSDADTGRATLAQGTVTLPVYDSTSFTSHSVSGLASPFGTLSGMAYSGPNGFTAYLLGTDGDSTLPFYAITGSPTDMAAAFAGGNVRHYSLTADPIQGLGGVPFMTNDTGINLSGATTSDFLVAEPSSPGDGSGRILQSWIAISGTGAGQQSAVGVNVGALDGAGFSLNRRGSYRASADGPSYQLFGIAAALGLNDGAFFGANGENFVVSDDMPGEPGHFHDSPSNLLAAGEDFSTIHVGNLTGEVASPTRSLSGTYQGFAAGLIEGVDIGAASLGENDDPSDVVLDFDPERKSLGGSITIDAGYYETPGGLTAAFGDGINDNTQNGGSAYIDDETFAATGNPNPDRTYVGQPDSSDIRYQREGQEAGTYLVSGSETDLATLGVSADHLCSTCDFLKWGWWGTQVQVSDPSDPSAETDRFSVHLGTWVAGDISELADIENSELAGASATYEGMAVGNVVSGDAAYIAAGDMDLGYDFGERTGTLNISNFDGRSFGGTVNDTSIADGKATFHGFLSGASDPIGGSANGAFVNNGNDIGKGVIGNFDVMTSEGDWRANGVFAGERTSIAAP